MKSNARQTPERGPRVPAQAEQGYNPLRELQKYGQSIWLDYIRRHLITSGELQRLVVEDGLRGLTSNPTIFEKAVAGSTDYDELLGTVQGKGEQDANALYEQIATGDVGEAADVLRTVYRQTEGRDGLVSLEVSPHLAHDTRRTVAEAHRLWKAVGRDNVMIKVPGTREGIPAIRQLIAEGINVNVTLLFARETYAEVAEAYIAGLDARTARGGEVSRIASVASFFVSRIDTAVDQLIEARLRAANAEGGADQSPLRWLLGKVAIANAKLAYQMFKEIFRGPRWEALAKNGAHVQRLLWASTSTKNPRYRDVRYVEELIGAGTINTMPPVTMDAFRDHGQPRPSLEEGVDEAREVMATLDQVGISMRAVTDQLVNEGVRLFADSLDQLLVAIEKKRQSDSTRVRDRMTFHLAKGLTARLTDTLDEWRRDGKVPRLWARDASLWTRQGESRWLDWLALTEDQRAQTALFQSVAAEFHGGAFAHAVLLGMGGSSLAPEVLARTFGRQDGYPELLVLDSTDPGQIAAVEARIDLRKTLFIVASKSGTTLEPELLKDYFYGRVAQTLGTAEAAGRFAAITDPDSKLDQAAVVNRFRRIFHGVPGIGGRYSALSNFALVPAAIMGLNVARLLDRAEEMVHACASCVPPAENPGVRLGLVLGVLARHGRDKITLVASPNIADLGAWIEQLLAESTGKDGKGLIPVDRETLGPPEVYGPDRLFVYLRLAQGADAAQDAALDALQQAGQPVVRIAVADPYDLGQEFFRWEMATAVACSVLGVNAFDQPDVEASKVEARKLTAAYEQTGALPAESEILQRADLKLFSDGKNATFLAQASGADHTLHGYLKAHLGRLQKGDYFALLAYVERSAKHEAQLQAIRHTIRDARHVATSLGFGPRFLHSTGQAYKGGPNTGVFLVLTCDDAHDLPVPGRTFSFGTVKAAQARGDFEVLAQRERRVLRVHLGPDIPRGLAALHQAVRQALA
jgi:transaldolase/glucose-6-phosphate isomerase